MRSKSNGHACAWRIGHLHRSMEVAEPVATSDVRETTGERRDVGVPGARNAHA